MYCVRHVPMVHGLNMMQRKENASVRKIKTVILPVKMVGLSFTIRKQEHVNVVVNRIIHIFMGKDVKKHALRQVVMKIVLPCEATCTLSSSPVDTDDGKRLYVSLGIFSVFRIERPAQYLISASDYCVPDKECVTNESDDPCSIFRNMAFPTGEFCPRSNGADRTTNGCNK